MADSLAAPALLMGVGVARTRGYSRLPKAAEATASPSDIAQMTRGIDAENIERTIHALVVFGTRNTLSTQIDPKRGISEARDWMTGEFRKIAALSDERMTVELQSFVKRVPF